MVPHGAAWRARVRCARMQHGWGGGPHGAMRADACAHAACRRPSTQRRGFVVAGLADMQKPAEFVSPNMTGSECGARSCGRHAPAACAPRTVPQVAHRGFRVHLWGDGFARARAQCAPPPPPAAAPPPPPPTTAPDSSAWIRDSGLAAVSSRAHAARTHTQRPHPHRAPTRVRAQRCACTACCSCASRGRCSRATTCCLRATRATRPYN
jgi:hypothetical protein